MGKGWIIRYHLPHDNHRGRWHSQRKEIQRLDPSGIFQVAEQKRNHKSGHYQKRNPCHSKADGIFYCQQKRLIGKNHLIVSYSVKLSCNRCRKGSPYHISKGQNHKEQYAQKAGCQKEAEGL